MQYFEDNTSILWFGDNNPTEYEHFDEYGDKTIICLDEDNTITYTDTNYAQEHPLAIVEVKDMMNDNGSKIKMDKKEKKEFDSLTGFDTIFGAFSAVENTGGSLDKRLFGNDTLGEDNENQLEFVRALMNPDLIELLDEPKKYYVKVPSTEHEYYFKYMDGTLGTLCNKNDTSDLHFTVEELRKYGFDNVVFEKEEA